MSIISVDSLSKAYRGNAVLKGLTFTVEKGAIFALLGSNGAGKTTTIHILSTLLKPDSGKVEVAGFNVLKDAKEVRHRISLTGQYAAVDELLTGEENMQLLGRLSRVPTPVIKQRTAELLEQFELGSAAKKPTSTYSGGMRRKLDLAISLLAAPEIIYLDEPTTGLDPRSRLELWHLIRDLAKKGTTIVLTTQYLDEADYLADKIAILNDGKIIAEGPAEALKKLVGGTRVELTFTSRAALVEAQGLFEKAHSDRANPSILQIPISDRVSEIRDLLNSLDASGIDVETMNIRGSTLDDVFMQLTGAPDRRGN